MIAIGRRKRKLLAMQSKPLYLKCARQLVINPFIDTFALIDVSDFECSMF